MPLAHKPWNKDKMRVTEIRGNTDEVVKYGQGEGQYGQVYKVQITVEKEIYIIRKMEVKFG